LIFYKVPDSYSTLVVPKNYLALVGVEHCTVYHHSAIIKVAHISSGFKIKNFESAIFRRCEKPFIVFLKPKCGNVARMTLKKNLWRRWNISAWGDFVDFYFVVGSHAKVLPVVSDSQFIDVRLREGNLGCGKTRSDIPELNSVVVSGSDYD